MKYANINFSLEGFEHEPLLQAILFERKEKNSFGLMLNNSLTMSSFYEELLFQIIDGKYSISYVEDNKDKHDIYEFNYPFENIKEYKKVFDDLPVKIFYYEKIINNIEDTREIINEFSNNENENIAFINEFQYSKLLLRGKLTNDLIKSTININEKFTSYLAEDITNISLTIENFYENINLQSVPFKWLTQIEDIFRGLIDFSGSPTQLAKGNLAFANNCIKTTINLPKTEFVDDKINFLSESVEKIAIDQIQELEITSENLYIYQSIIDILQITDVNDLKINIEEHDVSINIKEEASETLKEKVSIYKREVQEELAANFTKYIIPYELNTYNNSFIAIDQELNRYTYYIPDELFDDLMTIKNKFINMNAKVLEDTLKDENNDVTFDSFKQNWVEIEGKYRSTLTADVSKITYLITSDL